MGYPSTAAANEGNAGRIVPTSTKSHGAFDAVPPSAPALSRDRMNDFRPVRGLLRRAEAGPVLSDKRPPHPLTAPRLRVNVRVDQETRRNR
jgi:hypothetical protein